MTFIILWKTLKKSFGNKHYLRLLLKEDQIWGPDASNPIWKESKSGQLSKLPKRRKKCEFLWSYCFCVKMSYPIEFTRKKYGKIEIERENLWGFRRSHLRNFHFRLDLASKWLIQRQNKISRWDIRKIIFPILAQKQAGNQLKAEISRKFNFLSLVC